ncbi:trypsin-like peptidase domain-containing protein [Pseudomonas mangiferae]|uniref:Trypsin-like serine protease n=1 Tax=Pseudomonas mangiferae TaxID=2593654 RepID=A0A553GV65_9PSED|nr:trypsin-like peptidase domain-containing protein [Pseudomonas mangiferae]TRX73373.1 trypsin-like serine protease [Pseudomonas mangiferae]
MKQTLLCCVLLASMSAQADSLGPLLPQQTTEDSAAQIMVPKQKRLVPSPTVVDLGPLATTRAELAEPAKEGQPERIGLRRDIEALKDDSLTGSALNWRVTSAGGHIAAISLISPDALSVRAGLAVKNLPSSAVVRFYTQQDPTPVEVHASVILQAIERNLTADDQSVNARIYWSPPIQGNEITVEIELPEGVSKDALNVSLPVLSHLYRSPTDTDSKSEVKLGNSGACEVDYACEAGGDPSLDVKSRSTAKMIFVDDGDSYLCSGTLLNNNNQDRTPYFLSANHCISTQTSASSLATFWFYRATACKGLTLDPTTTTLYGGAQLLYHSANTDTAFLRLLDAAPAGATFAGWSTDATSYKPGQAVLGVHYPRGDVQKISHGKVDSYSTCTSSGSNKFICKSSFLPKATFLGIIWNSGITEGGSSGSSLFSGDQVIGQLYGGGSSCLSPTKPDHYGLLSVAYNAKLKDWLSPSATIIPSTGTAVEYFNPDLNHYFMTADPAEQAYVDTGAVGKWLRTGQTFKAGGSKAVCRFYGNTLPNPATGVAFGPNSHFYTADTSECDFLVGFYNPAEPSWKFESYDFNITDVVGGACPTGTVPVYRLYNRGYERGVASNHRFTRDLALANQMAQEGWSFEDVKMCAPQ